MKDQAKLPLHLTYRAVGSTTGQFEHLGVDNPSTNSFEPYSYFGSGDIPISAADRRRRGNRCGLSAVGCLVVNLLCLHRHHRADREEGSWGNQGSVGGPLAGHLV